MKENYWIRAGEELQADNFSERQHLKDKQEQEQQHQENLKQQQQHHPDHKHWRKVDTQQQLQQVKSAALLHSDVCNNNITSSNNNIRQLNIEGRQGEARRAAVVAEAAEAQQCSKRKKSEPPQIEKLSRQVRADSNTPLDYLPQSLPKPIEQVNKSDNDVNLSFCGCGFLGIYHVGVASCFHEYAPQLSMHKISGSSAGALVALAHICGNLQLAYATTDILRVAIDARSRALGPFHPSFDINATIREALERGLPEDVHLKASGKLHVSLTRVYDGQNVVISEFESKEDVIQALICSCFIPFWSGLKAPKFKGVTYIDGGFSNNLLILDDKTVTVSPFAGEADICPQDDTFNLLQVTLSNTSFSLTPDNLYRLSHALLPPKPEMLSDLCEQGFADGIRFLQRMKLISCNKCLEIRSSLLVTENGEDMEEAVTQQVEQTGENEEFTGNFSSFKSQDGTDSGSHHIRLEQQEQKMIEISGSRTRRDSVVSCGSMSQIMIAAHQHHSTSSATTPATPAATGAPAAANDATTRAQPTRMQGNSSELRRQRQVNCDQCHLIRQKALCGGPLPKQFSDRIRAACDTVNKSLSNWIYSHRPIKYLSYLAAPYYLPVDISLALLFKCWQSLPFIQSELIDCVYNIIEFLIGIVKRMHATSTTSKLLMGACSWEKEAFAYEKEIIRRHQHQVHQSASGGDHANPVGSSSQGDSTTTTTTTTSSTTVESSFSLKITTDGLCVSKRKNSHTITSTSQLHSLEDTFDSIVDVTSNQEARIFAYYFRDAKNRLQVTEIFDYQRAAELSSSSSSASLDPSDSPASAVSQTAHHLTGSATLPAALQSRIVHK